MVRKRPPIRRACLALSTQPQKCAKTQPSTKVGPVDCDALLSIVQRNAIKANVNRAVATIGSLKLRMLHEQYVAGALFAFFVCPRACMHSVVMPP